MSQPQLLTIDFLGIGSDKNEIPQLDSAMDCHQQRQSIQSCLGRIKPHMLQQVLSQEYFGNAGFSRREIYNEVSEGIKTMDLFPQHSLGFESNRKQDNIQLPVLDTHIKSPEDAAATDLRPANKSSSAQLTIFYNGTVKVYSDISSGKAEAIMMLAATGSGEASPSDHRASSNFVPKISNSLPLRRILRKGDSNPERSTDFANQICPVDTPNAKLPLAKNLSLQRFLEKRKDRLNRIPPYLRASKN